MCQREPLGVRRPTSLRWPAIERRVVPCDRLCCIIRTIAGQVPSDAGLHAPSQTILARGWCLSEAKKRQRSPQRLKISLRGGNES